jgi:hypothetical protein
MQITQQSFLQVKGSPEGGVWAPRGSIATDIDTGRLFVKRTLGDVATGWQVQTLSFVGTAEDPNGSFVGYVGDTYTSLSGVQKWTKLLGDGNNTGWK